LKDQLEPHLAVGSRRHETRFTETEKQQQRKGKGKTEPKLRKFMAKDDEGKVRWKLIQSAWHSSSDQQICL